MTVRRARGGVVASSSGLGSSFFGVSPAAGGRARAVPEPGLG